MRWAVTGANRAALRASSLVALLLLVAACGGGGQAAPPPIGLATTSSPARPPTGFVPASASFPTVDDGFAWGIYPCPDDPRAFCSGLAVTHDEGTTWKLRSAPSGTPIDPYE